MKGIILAAGRGSRLKKLTDTQPKCLLKIGNRSLLSYQVDAFLIANIRHIAIVTGYLFKKINHPSITTYFHNPMWERTNMVYSLTVAKSWLENETCFISYSDIFYQPQLF